LIRDTLGDSSSLNAKLTYIVQEKRLSIAHTIHIAIKYGFVDKSFVVYLGDNILSSGIEKHVKKFVESDNRASLVL
jgi:dTDP-glucose pyrophosphorylase